MFKYICFGFFFFRKKRFFKNYCFEGRLVIDFQGFFNICYFLREFFGYNFLIFVEV